MTCLFHVGKGQFAAENISTEFQVKWKWGLADYWFVWRRSDKKTDLLPLPKIHANT